MKTVLSIALIINLVWSYHLATQLKTTRAEVIAAKTARLEDADTFNDEIQRLNEEAEAIAQANRAQAIEIDELKRAALAVPVSLPDQGPSTTDQGPSTEAPVFDPPAQTAAVEQARQAGIARQRADLEHQRTIAQRTLDEWTTKAKDEEKANLKQSGIKTSQADLARRKAEVAAALKAKQAEIDELTRQLSLLR